MNMRRQRSAKIVATLGPASSSPEMIRALFEAGADVFRFNFSHGTQEEHQKRYDIVRAIEQETGRPIAVLADLQGPKLRVGRLAEGPITLEEGERIRFDLDPAPGTRDRVPLPHPEVFAALAPGVQPRRGGWLWCGARMRCTSRSSGACLRSWTTPVRSSRARGLRGPATRSRAACRSASRVERTCCALPRCRDARPTRDHSEKHRMGRRSIQGFCLLTSRPRGRR